MSTAGPELPPHLIAKRRRQEEETQAAEVISPSPKPNSPIISPANSENKRRRTIGPSLPPAPLSELPPITPTKSSNSDSSDDDFGPSLPTHNSSTSETHRNQKSLDDEEAAAAASAQIPQREEWMLIPPSADDWTARVDPTKLRNRKFNTGKGSKAPAPSGRGAGGDQHTLWTETPEQRRQRLEDEVMGVKKPAQLGGPEKEESGWREAESRETSRRIREYNVSKLVSFRTVCLRRGFWFYVWRTLLTYLFPSTDDHAQEKNRNASLYSEHKKSVPKEKEDDPSKRAFDKEKDIGGGVKIRHAKRKELLNHAADFSSRFAGGNYL